MVQSLATILCHTLLFVNLLLICSRVHPRSSNYLSNMQLHILLALAPALVPLVSATCYSGGEKWPNKEHAVAASAAFCKKAKGHYNPSESFGLCDSNSESNIRYNFRVWNKSNVPGGKTLSEETCKFRMSREIIGCERGGRRSEGDWEVM